VVPVERTVTGAARLLDLCVSPLLRGPADPTLRRTPSGWWRTARSPYGPGLQRLVRSGDDVDVTCWGPGADWLAEQAPRLLGSTDDASTFDPAAHRAVAEAHRRRPWLRLGRTDLVLDALAPASIEQVVTGKEAFRAQRLLLQHFGERPGGPALDEQHPASGMRLPLSAPQWLSVPNWEFLRAGVEARRTRAILAGARTSTSLERLADHAYTGDADAALRSLPGVGPWTSAAVRQRALGDPDAWSIGDYHVGHHISFVLVGEQLDDDAVTELLEPYRGHRFRVEVLLAGMPGPERHGPRRSLPTHLPR
jgi:3-methyladenine DNA glycosylase/8-oxoguanine DNA glycosylase